MVICGCEPACPQMWWLNDMDVPHGGCMQTCQGLCPGYSMGCVPVPLQARCVMALWGMARRRWVDSRRTSCRQRRPEHDVRPDNDGTRGEESRGAVLNGHFCSRYRDKPGSLETPQSKLLGCVTGGYGGKIRRQRPRARCEAN